MARWTGVDAARGVGSLRMKRRAAEFGERMDGPGLG